MKYTSTGRPRGNFNEHGAHGYFGKGRQYSNYGVEEELGDTGYGIGKRDRSGNIRQEFVNDEDFREDQIRRQEEEAKKRTQDTQKLDEYLKKENQKAAIRGKIEKLKKKSKDPNVKESERTSAKKQIVVLQNKLASM